MIASQKIGKSFMGALNYNLKKLRHSDPLQRAELLDTNFNSLDLRIISEEVGLVRELRPNLNRYVYHTSLNFAIEDKLSNDHLLDIAHQYLEEQGFTNNQFFIFRHHDAGHPHIHLLVNRITFDGEVVSDSNNFKRSEAILRSIERQYDLVQVSGSKSSGIRAATRAELEMIVRKGKPSGKMLFQEVLADILKMSGISLPDFIRQCEAKGIHLLFNQQSTGHVSGITYCSDNFKSTGQKLGNRFKWSELIKQLDYEQNRDGKAISEANGRTKARYGDFSGRTAQPGLGGTSNGFYRGGETNFAAEPPIPATAEETRITAYGNRARPLETDQDAGIPDYRSANPDDNRFDGISIEIADDEDDERSHGRERRKYRR